MGGAGGHLITLAAPHAADHTLYVETDPTPGDVAAVVAGLVGFNTGHAGPEGWQRLAVLLRNADGGVAAGLLASTHWNWLFVSHLWVGEALRGQGIGRTLLEAAEQEAVRRGCEHAWVDTFSFQARGFYERLGWERFGQLADFPPGHTRYFLQKRRLAAGV